MLPTERERREVAQALTDQLRGGDADEVARSLMVTHPEVVAAYLVATGLHHYQEGTYWEAVRKEFPQLTEKGLTAWRNGFLRFLATQGLPAFEHVPGHRYVMPILAHGGVPRHCLEAFFDLLVWPAVSDVRWAGVEAEDLLGEASHSAAFERLPKPAQRFLRFGGQAALDFLQASLEMARSDRPEEAAIAAHVREAFVAFRQSEPRLRVSAGAMPRFRRPTMTFEPATGLVSLLLPTQQLPEHGDLAEVVWVLEADGRPERLPVQLAWAADGPETREARWWIQAPPRRLRVSLWAGVQRLREWDWNFGEKPFTCFLFDGETEQAVTREVVPAGTTWVLVPETAAMVGFSADGGTLPVPDLGAAGLAGAWQEITARLIDTTDLHKLRIERGTARTEVLVEARGRDAEQPARPREFGDGRLRWALFGLSGRAARIEFVEAPVQLDLPSIERASHPCLLVDVPRADAVFTLGLYEGGVERQRIHARPLPRGGGASTRRLFALQAFTDALRNSRSGSLQLRLRAGTGQDEAVVATVTQAWNPVDLACTWRAEDGALEVGWRERVALSERYAWLWDLWRPWNPPLEAPIGDDAAGAWTWPHEKALAPGRYRLQLGLNSVWNPLVPTYPTTGAPATCEVTVGVQDGWEAYLTELGDDPRARATRFLARAGHSDRAVEETHYLEARVEPSDIDPLMRTVAALERFSDADRTKWRDRMREIACDYCAFDVARWLGDYWDRTDPAARGAGLEALLALGWLCSVGSNWEPLPRPFALGDKRLVPQEPLDDATRARLWGIWRPLGLGLEVWPLDAAAVQRLTTNVPGAETYVRPWRVGAAVSRRGRRHEIEALLPPEGEAFAPDTSVLWRTAPPEGWRLRLAGVNGEVPVADDTELVREASSELHGVPVPDFTDALAYSPERWTSMLGFLGNPPLLSAHGATVADAQWLRRFGAEPAAARGGGDWAMEWQGILRSKLEEAAARTPALAPVVAPTLAGFARIAKPREVGYRLAAFPFVVSAVAVLARLRAWRMIDTNIQGLTRNVLDSLVREAHQWAPDRFERELLLADLLVGTWGEHAPPGEESRP
jgi:hypothetical protein